MNAVYEELYTKLFPESSVDVLKEVIKTLSIFPSEKEGALYSKKNKLYMLEDKELNDLGNDNYQQQRYMRRCEDAVVDSCDENKRGFYTAWNQLEMEEFGIKFEVSRRKFLDERKESAIK